MSQIINDLHRYQVLRWEQLGSSTRYKIATMMRATLQCHEVMADVFKHYIKRHPSITSIFVYFFVTSKISEPLQETTQMKKYIKDLRKKSDSHYGRLAKLKE